MTFLSHDKLTVSVRNVVCLHARMLSVTFLLMVASIMFCCRLLQLIYAIKLIPVHLKPETAW